MDPFRAYTDINTGLMNGEKLYFNPCRNGGRRLSPLKSPGCRKIYYPRIGILAGTGTSHSWLWFVDLFERMGFHDLKFLDEEAVQNGGLDNLNVLAVSGGDTFAIAKALGPSGAKCLKLFVEQGGLYLGACAGAYLPMNSSKTPLDLFNFAQVKITNLSKTLPKAEQMPHKFCLSYGCDFIFHPVREDVKIRTCGVLPFIEGRSISAPLYGGPGMTVHGDAQVMASYEGFTKKTAFLIHKVLAENTLLGKAAAVRTILGKGRMYLFGPHLEHPFYPEANQLIADTIFWDNRSHHTDQNFSKENFSFSEGKNLIRDLKRELSNSRIVAAGLEILPIRWLIGEKSYEPEKFRVFLESMWRRIRILEKCRHVITEPMAAHQMTDNAKEITRLLRKMKRQIDRENDTLDLAGQIFDLLHKLSMGFFGLYFRTISE